MGFKINYRQVYLLLAALMISGAAGHFLPAICVAEDAASDTEGSGIEPGVVFNKIQPPPEFDAGRIIKSGNAEDFFDVVGEVNLIEDERIVVGDLEFKIAPGVHMSGIKRWSHVGLRFNKAGEVTACEKLKNVSH
ncbi:MAG: hypothetical protein ACKVE4_04775 [Dissulfuribacterales bacterium]